MICCTVFVAHAQQMEQVAQELAINEYKKFAEQLPSAFDKGRVGLFGHARALKKQFFLEDSPQAFADFLGWDTRKYSQRTLGNVFKALSNNAKSSKKNSNPISVVFDFPVSPYESYVSVKKDRRGTPNIEKKATQVFYVATTSAEVMFKVSKAGVPTSIVNHRVTLIWDGKINLVNGAMNERKKNPPPILRTIEMTPIDVSSEPKEEVMRTRAKNLIEEWYRNLQLPATRSAVLSPEIPNKTNFEDWLHNSIRIEIMGTVNVPLPSINNQTIEVRNVPEVKIHLDPLPFMTEDASQYSSTEAYHQLSLVFTVDFQADKIAKVVYVDRFVRPELAPKLEPAPLLTDPDPAPIVLPVQQSTGEYYKVQFLFRGSLIDPAELPEIYKVENMTIEKYYEDDIPYFKYVVPARSIGEAVRIRDRLIEKGIEDAWIAVYENDERIRPLQGRPEVVNP